MTPSRGYRRLFDLRLGGRARADAEMDLEIESHLQMRVADLVRAGWSPEAARTEAMRRFGHFATARRQLHSAARQREAAMRQRDWFGSLVADVRYAIRQAKRAAAVDGEHRRQGGQAFLGTAERMQDRLDLAGPVGRCPGPEPVGHALHG
jgi:hypothetical protein